jgi:hypothetical protein
MREFLITFVNGEDQVEIIYWFVSEPQHGRTADSFASMMQSCLGTKISDCSADARQYIQDILITEADTVGDPNDYIVHSVGER